MAVEPLVNTTPRQRQRGTQTFVLFLITKPALSRLPNAVSIFQARMGEIPFRLPCSYCSQYQQPSKTSACSLVSFCVVCVGHLVRRSSFPSPTAILLNRICSQWSMRQMHYGTAINGAPNKHVNLLKMLRDFCVCDFLSSIVQFLSMNIVDNNVVSPC